MESASSATSDLTSGIEQLEVDCCIAGGGPAGMMLGDLLARSGVRVVVLEKHTDFLRDFRGDTIHPSTLAVMDRVGLLDALLRTPHQEMKNLTGQWHARPLPLADFSRLPTRVIARALDAKCTLARPWPLRIISRWIWLRYQTARVLGWACGPSCRAGEGWLTGS